jgi:hypothetical protein
MRYSKGEQTDFFARNLWKSLEITEINRNQEISLFPLV